MFCTYAEWHNLDIFHPKDTYQDWKSKDWYDYYKMKNYYAEIGKAQSILEIGVRLGYSAYSFLSSPNCYSYLGIDIQKPIDGGMDFETFDWVKEKVFSKFSNIQAGLIKMDSQIDVWPDIKFDFIHVDGLHTYDGTYNDLNKAWEHLCDNGLLVLDDYIFIHEVRRAGRKFCKENHIPIILGPSKRGDLLIWKT